MRKFLIYGFLILIFCSSISAQDKFLAKVQIYVQHNGTSPKQEQMVSYISRELRSLGDVEIVSENPDYRIDVVMVDLVVGGKNTGYAISISFLKSAKCIFKDKYIDDTPVILDCDASLWGTTAAINLDYLKDTAESLVAKFDNNILSPDREFFNRNKKSRDAIDKTKVKPN